MILSTQEAADALGYSAPDELPGRVTSIILPGISDYLKTATGKDWSDSADPTAKLVAAILLVRWNDDPGLMGKVDNSDKGLIGLIAQLQAKVLLESEASI
jgi:hypothetical protein